MRKSIFLFLGVFFVLTVFLAKNVEAAAGINRRINFQGKVVKTDGTNVADNNYNFQFSLWTTPTVGTSLWSEVWNAGNSQIGVSSGIFSVDLGTNSTFPASIDFNADTLYLSIGFSGEADMSPRIRLTAVPYAFNAEKVGGLTVTNTTGTLTIPNGKTISFADGFTTVGAGITLNQSLATTNSVSFAGLSIGGSVAFTNLPIGTGTTILYIGAGGNLTAGTLPSGVSYTATNGLNLNANAFGLGGTLTQNTQIGASSFTLSFLGLGNSLGLSIGQSGFVGVGTSNPDSLFSVASNISGGFGTGVQSISVKNTSSANSATTIGLYPNSGSDFDVSIWGSGATPANKAVLIQRNNAPFGIYTNNIERFSIIGSGNIGVGTTNPAYKLQIVGDVGVSTSLTVGTSASIGTNLTVGGTVSFTNLPLGTGSTVLYIGAGGVLTAGTLPAGVVYTATNGLNLNGSAFGLGGTLTQNTQIGTSDYSLSFIGLSGNQSLFIGSSGYVGIGTTNPKSLFQVVNLIGFSGSSTYVGQNAFGSSTAAENSAFGGAALFSNTSGQGNSAFGYNALNTNRTGYYNTALGDGALYYNRSGQRNIAIGWGTLYMNSTGSNNIAIGNQSLYENKSDNNVALGHQSGYYSQTGINNVFIGTSAAYGSIGYSGADNNTIVGAFAGVNIGETQVGNVFLGYQAGYNEKGSNKLYIANNDTTPLIYGDFSTGYVGLGTTNPQAKLYIKDFYRDLLTLDNGSTVLNINTIGEFLYAPNTNDGNSYVVNFGNNLTAASSANADFFVINPSSMNFGNLFNIKKANVSAFVVDTNSNVGIGTTNPQALLNVAGTSPVIRITNTQDKSWNIGDVMAGFEFYSSDNSGNYPAVATAIKSIVEKTTYGNSNGLGFYTNNDTGNPVEGMRLASNGYLGLGTTLPETILDIVGGTGLRLRDVVTNNANKIGLIVGGHYTNTEENITLMSIDSTVDNNILRFGGDSSVSRNSATMITFFTSANNTTLGGSERIRIDSSGNVGIGTTNPSKKLSVAGDIKQDNNYGYYFRNSTNTSDVLTMSYSAGNNLQLSNAEGNINFSVNHGAGNITFDNNWATTMILTPSNRVGIGTTSPSAKLEVNGNVSINGELNLNNFYITNGTQPGDSNFIGYQAGLGATSASNVNFFGYRAGYNATNAYSSNFFGNSAGLGSTNASFSNFFGYAAGDRATNAHDSNFFGEFAGRYATGAYNSNFFGYEAGLGATSAHDSNFFGYQAGGNATNAYKSNFIGYQAGVGASNAYISNFIGHQVGVGASNAYMSNFIGNYAGYGASNASSSNFIGQYAGGNARWAYYSNFIGNSAGRYATNAYYSNIFGYNAGLGATDAADSIFLGSYAGYMDTVNNNGTAGASIAIGRYAGTGGFSNSIAIGRGVINTGTTQVNIGNVLYINGIYNSDTQSGAAVANSRVGIGTTGPSNRLTVGSDSLGASLTPDYTFSLGSTDTDTIIQLGQSGAGKAYFRWNYNATPANAYLSIGTVGQNIALVQAGGNVGIGNTSPAYKLDVQTSNPGGYVMSIKNIGDSSISSSDKGLLISLGLGNSRPATNYYVAFANAAGTVNGKIRGAGTGTTGVQYYTGGADYAEYFKKSNPSEDIPAGNLVKIDGNNTVTKSNSAQTIGVVSDTSGFIGNGPSCPIENDEECNRDLEKYNALVGLTGQIRTFVSTENGPIAPGDPLTVSSTPGVAAKAVKAGYTVGHALESYNGPGIVRINSYINPSWYDPDVFISKTGQISINYKVSDSVLTSLGYTDRKNELETASYSLTDSAGNAVSRIGQFEQLAAAKINTGFLSVSGAVIDNIAAKKIVSEEVKTNNLISNKIGASEASFSAVTTDMLIIPEGNISDVIATRINNLREEVKSMMIGQTLVDGPSLAQMSFQEIQFNYLTKLDGIKYAVAVLQTENISPLIDSNGNPVEIKIDGNVKINGVLTVDSIKTNSIEGLDVSDQIASLNEKYNQLKSDVLGVNSSLAMISVASTGVVSPTPTSEPTNFLTKVLAEFWNKVLFKGETEFEKNPLFNKDTAGLAILNVGETGVEVKFDNSFEATPIVNISLIADSLEESQSLSENYVYYVANRNQNGFVIRLNKAAKNNIKFSWTALLIKDVKTSQNQVLPTGVVNQEQIVAPTITVIPTLEPSIVPTTEPTIVPTLVPTLEPTLAPTPTEVVVQ